jgi:hypothetical protein
MEQKMKKLYVLLITTILLIAACQKTPDEPIVQSKDKDLVQEVVEANKEENKKELQEDKQVIEQQIEAINKHLGMEFQANERVKIVVDADVEISTYDAIPMVRVEPYNFTKEHLEILLDELCGQNPVYYVSRDGHSHWSRDEIEEILPEIKGYFLSANIDLKNDLEKIIEFIYEQYETALSRNEEQLYDGNLTVSENNKFYSTSTSLKSYLGRNQAARIEVSQSFNATRSSLSFDNQPYGAKYTSFEQYEGIDADKVDKSYEECYQMAINFKHKLTGENCNLSIVGSRIGYSLNTYAGYTKETSGQCYSFTFAKVFNGVYAYPKNSLHKKDNINYTQVIETERINILVDNSGICFFRWGNPTKYKDTISQDTPLVDFEEVNNVFKNYCGYSFSWVPQYDNIPDDVTVTININKVEFNLMVTKEKDDIGSYIMIPVWDFVGDITYDQEVFTVEGEPYEGENNIAILTINAIDGTIINREQGY